MELELREVSKHIGKAVILDNITMHLHGGQIYGFAGKNGSGKAMLMRCATGLMKPTSGTVAIDGKRLWKDISFPESVGLLLETPAFLPSLTGLDNLRQLCDIRRVAGDAEIGQTLRDVGLNPDDRRRYRKYSLGMKQRLGIAAAVVERPDLVVLDEPVNALDAAGVEQIRALILRQKERGALVIVACHDKGEMSLLADEIFTLEAGRVISHIEDAKGE